MARVFEIHESCRELFGRHRMDSFRSWMAGDPGVRVSRSGGGEVRRVQLDHEAFYLKRRSGEALPRLAAMAAFGRRPMSGPVRELRLVEALAEAGFAVMEPVAWGERRVAGLPREGFLVVREVPGKLLADCFREADPAGRRALMEHLGNLLGRLHARGFFQHLRLKDVIVAPDGTLTLIDRETGQPWARRFTGRLAVKSLARTARRTLRDGHRFGPAATGAFLRGYRAAMDGTWRVSSRDLLSRIARRMRSEMAG